MASNPWEDCNRARKPFYKPIDAAIRWCGLVDKETWILKGVAEHWRVKRGEWTDFPCLAIHSEAIEHAIAMGALPHGRDGNSTSNGEHVAPPRRTIAHADLKEWLRREHPADAQKPHMSWLFDEVERGIHSAVTTDAYMALKAEADALKTRAESAEKRAEQAESIAQAAARSGEGLDARERVTLMRIVRALGTMANLPNRGAATSVEKQMDMLGFGSPKEATIRALLAEAQELQPDFKM